MNKLKYIILAIGGLVSVISCKEDNWLKEEAYDFYTVDNSYTTPEQFNSAVSYLYSLTRKAMFETEQTGYLTYFYTTDVAYCTTSLTQDLNPLSDALIPENTGTVLKMWTLFYQIISNANLIIDRIDDESIKFTSESERNELKAEACFFRAFAYRNLGIQWGGVPLVLDEIAQPKRDFTRATQQEVWTQCITDLTYAVENLPEVTEVEEDGRLTKAAANQLLAELYIITKDWDKAINCTNAIIESGNYSLMTERFGSWKDKEGDVYGDLFRRGNQNRSSGNKESIWVCQYEYQTTGGGVGNILTRFLVPRYWKLIGDSDNKNLFIGPTSQDGGRGIGWMSASDYLINQVWESDENDMRNSQYNIIRDVVANNPKSVYYGQKIVESGAIDNYPNTYRRDWSVIFAKSAPINDFPEECIDDPETGATNTNAQYTFRDHYYMRLAETYLLRAEAYLGKGDQSSAAADINIVRARANAAPVAAADVNIDYILDERARELHFEEFRLLTLMRLNKFTERRRLYNPMANFTYNTNETTADYNNLWPIPQSEIETNTGATLEQNPGYN